MKTCEKCGQKFTADHPMQMFFLLQDEPEEHNVVTVEKAVDLGINLKKAILFRGCPNCMTNEYIKDIKTKKHRMYERGERILSLDELMKQDFVYWHNKITPKGWFQNWQMRMASNAIGEKGCIYYAIKVDEREEVQKQ